MKIEEAAIAKLTSEKWGFAIFTKDWEGKDCKPVLYLLEKTDKGKWQLCGGWRLEDLVSEANYMAGIAIDYGAGWVCPGEEFYPIMTAAEGWLDIYKLPNVDYSKVF